MSDFIFEEVTSYRAMVYSPFNTTRAFAYLVSDNSICFLTFCSDDTTLPENRSAVVNGIQHFYISLYYSDYPNVIDLLRNEKPVHFYYCDEHVKHFYLTSSYEPIGEAE